MGINLVVEETDYRALGRAYDQLKNCFIPEIERLLHSEAQLEMNGSVTDSFARQLSDAHQNIVTAVTGLGRLVKSDSRLTEGSFCVVTSEACKDQNYSQNRTVSSVYFIATLYWDYNTSCLMKFCLVYQQRDTPA